MERRQSRIAKLLDTILEEKWVLNDNLEKIINQMSVLVDQAKHTDSLRPKNMTEILTLEMDIMRKFININYELETFIENKLQLTFPETTTETTTLQNLTDQSTTTQQSEVLIPQLDPHSLGDDSFNSGHHFTDPDVQLVRETFKEITQKLGLNAPNLNSMRHFYEKPSTSALRELHRITLSDVSNSLSRISGISQVQPIDNSDEGSSDSFQIPEKDLNSAKVEELSIQKCDMSKNEYKKDVSVSQPFNYNHDTLVESNTGVESDQSEAMCTADNSSQDNSSFKDVQSYSMDESSDEEYEKNNIVFEGTNAGGSVLEKLNNYMSTKQDELNIEPLKLPDLQLKPIKNEAINIIQNINTQSEKKKKSKKKNENKPPDNKIYTFKPKKIPKESDLCVFSHIVSPSEFYIHMVDEESTLIDRISEDIFKHYQNTCAEYETKKRAYSGINRFCCGFIPDYDSWYRLEVLDWLIDKDDEDVLVQLVDYGMKCRVSFKYLRKLKKEFSKIPMLAIKCHFPLMYPPESTFRNLLTEWPVSSVENFTILSGLNDPKPKDNKTFKLAYVNYDQELRSLAVDLYNISHDSEQTVGQILLDLGHAEQIVNEDYDDSSLGEFLQDIETLEKDENINEVVTGYDARDEARICKFTKPDGTCFKGKNCKLEHIPLSKGNIQYSAYYSTDSESDK